MIKVVKSRTMNEDQHVYRIWARYILGGDPRYSKWQFPIIATVKTDHNNGSNGLFAIQQNAIT